MVSRCVGEPTNARNAVTVTTVTAALQGPGWGAAQAGRGPGDSGREEAWRWRGIFEGLTQRPITS